MDAFLGKVTQHAMNYAIRSGIGITAGFAIKQTSRLLKTVEDGTDYQELHDLQTRLDGKIRIISPSIDMIELISAKGNTTLESAVTLTKALRWDIQSLGIRLAKAAAAEEESRRNKNRAKTRAAHALEIRLIVQDIKKLLTRIEDAVPLINLAITTSGARLSTALPSTVSPSRLLQASTFLTAGDTQFSMNPTTPMQVGPSFTLSLYMLFAGYAREHDDSESIRDMAWKEVIHKARVKLMRAPLQSNYALDRPNTPLMESIENIPNQEPLMPGEGKANEYAYHIEIIEDLDDDRVHSFEDDSPTPGPYGDVQLAGIREFLPVHQISKIFYASTGKILNIGEGETNSPVLLLKRDINALPPRRMMKGNEREDESEWVEESEDASGDNSIAAEESDNDSQDELDRQIRRESSAHIPASDGQDIPSDDSAAWRFPPDLDPEWLALEVYAEEEDDSSTEDGDDPHGDSAYVSHRPSSSQEGSGQAKGDASYEAKLSAGISHLHLGRTSSPSPSPSPSKSVHERVASPAPQHFKYSPKSPFGNIRSSLSLMEMLIRLTALQQFQQASHLAIPDELLTFFLEESSTTGAGGDGDERRRTRREARRKVGFDPYDESPIKRHGEDYQYQEGNGGYSRGGTPYDEFDRNGYVPSSPHWQRERSMTPQGTPEPWLLRSTESPSRRGISEASPSPQSPYRPQRKAAGPLDRVQLERRVVKTGSPLGRGISVETDSTLGTSPASPTLVGKREDKTI